MKHDNEKKSVKRRNQALPIARNEDVEFSREVADEDDLEALQRAREADQRQRQ